MDEAKRKHFIGRLSRALGREKDMPPAFVEPFDYSTGPQETMYQNMSRDEIIAMFKKECDRNGTRYCNTTPDKVGEALIQAIADWGNGKIVYPDVPEVKAYGIDKAIANDKNKDRTFVQWDPKKGREENIMLTQNSDIGITFPMGGLAETATIIQASDVGCGRSISLLPNTHIAILRTDSIVPRMTQMVEKLEAQYKAGEPVDFPSNVVMVSGPSNTADIELIRVNGAHGPLQVTYILVD